MARYSEFQPRTRLFVFSSAATLAIVAIALLVFTACSNALSHISIRILLAMSTGLLSFGLLLPSGFISPPKQKRWWFGLACAVAIYGANPQQLLKHHQCYPPAFTGNPSEILVVLRQGNHAPPENLIRHTINAHILDFEVPVRRHFLSWMDSSQAIPINFPQITSQAQGAAQASLNFSSIESTSRPILNAETLAMLDDAVPSMACYQSQRALDFVLVNEQELVPEVTSRETLLSGQHRVLVRYQAPVRYIWLSENSSFGIDPESIVAIKHMPLQEVFYFEREGSEWVFSGMN